MRVVVGRRREAVNAGDEIVELKLDVVVQIPVHPQRDDAFFTAVYASLECRIETAGRECAAPVEIGVAVARGKFPRTPGVTRPRERRCNLRRTEAADFVVRRRNGVALGLAGEYPRTFEVPAGEVRR